MNRDERDYELNRTLIFEEAKDGRIWSRFSDIHGIVGNGATIDEAGESLFVSIRLASEAGEGIL